MKKIVIAAGTGFLGKVLIRHFREKTDEIVILTRGNNKAVDNIRYVNWDARTLGLWTAELEGADVLINLAGRSVDCRYTPANRHEILASRIESTSVLNRAVLQCTNPPSHWLNSSTATIYRHSEDKQMDEANGEIGSDFSMDVAKAWEKTFFKTETPLTIKTALRTSIVLGTGGGAFPALLRLARLGAGGTQGSGRQFISWIHEEDFARAVEFIIQEKMKGVVNVVAPEPVRNADFMAALRKTAKVPFGLPMPEWLLKTGAAIIGTETELVLKSRNVIPKRLIELGYTFKYSNLESTFTKLISH